MFGVVPALVDQSGKEIEGAGEGFLVIKQAWPGQVRADFYARMQGVCQWLPP